MMMPSGQILICKVLMLKSTKDMNYPFFYPEKSASENYFQSPIKLQDYGINTTVVYIYNSNIIKYRMKDNESKHKVWFIMDSSLILPEYLVEFDYLMSCNFQGEYQLVETQIRTNKYKCT